MNHTTPEIVVPRIDHRRCTGCGTCQRACPTGAVAVQGRFAAVVHPEACRFCEICETVCPNAAIERPFTVVFAPSERAAELSATDRKELL